LATGRGSEGGMGGFLTCAKIKERDSLSTHTKIIKVSPRGRQCSGSQPLSPTTQTITNYFLVCFKNKRFLALKKEEPACNTRHIVGGGYGIDLL